ncbi:hypothetical protein FBEOM_508 [Fusarium beomiforme]|uniref:Uncharacterized protein n=1 Tax=Fusarium beomiforme TaxID=44412 RepID=A0A9P5AV41_9HYPO|nr:hypothetical protein FBEOM_508 [Fusarium beomiforme]
MASLERIANFFSECKYDEKEGFHNVIGKPCLACVSHLDRDVTCRCVTRNEPTSCVLCESCEIECVHSVVLELCGRSGASQCQVKPPASKLTWRKMARLRREMQAISLLQSAGAEFSLEEFRERIVAAQPAYTRNDNCVATLRDALVRLSTAETTVVPGFEEKVSNKLSGVFPAELRGIMDELSEDHSLAPRFAVIHNGMPHFPVQIEFESESDE